MDQSSVFGKYFDIYDKNDYHIDRNEENKLVAEYQKTGDLELLEKIYIKRIPTLKNWARNHYYPGLDFTINDFMEELTIVFLYAAKKYKPNKGSFNTCLYTFLLNRIKNIKNSLHAKKRRPPKTEDGGGLLSLNYSYSSSRKGGNSIESSTLENALKEDYHTPNKNQGLELGDSISILSNGDPVLEYAFRKLGEGNTISGVIRQVNHRTGNLTISKEDITDESMENIKMIINQKENINNDFKVLDYSLTDTQLSYSIQLKESKESRLIKKAIKNLRKNKKDLLLKINR